MMCFDMFFFRNYLCSISKLLPCHHPSGRTMSELYLAHACRQPVVLCFGHWRLSEDQNIEHYINSRVNCNSKLIINMKSKIQNQCLVKFSLMQVILTNFPHKILRCMSTSIDRLPTGVVATERRPTRQTCLTGQDAYCPNFHSEWSSSCLQDLANQTLLPLALPNCTANNFHCHWAR